MARRKASDKKETGKKRRSANVQADDHSIAFEELHVGGDVSGDIRIGHTIGYTAEQVSVLLKQITTTLQPKPFDGRCPYKGLEVFEEEDAELFFGRERLVNELVGRVKESRTVFITGPSGSGKSSLVRAGLIHALKHSAIKSSDRWLYETMKPGREPLKDLALAFSRLKSPELEDYFLAHSAETETLNKCAESVLSGRKDQRFVLFIDQFEEVFTQINSEEERVSFINMLAHAGTVENGRVIVLFAMRSDFVSNCATYPALNELLSQEFRQIGAMQPEELVGAIALPAMHVGLPVEDELIARIINDMKGEPGALPLMQFALKDLFDSQQAKGGIITLTLQDYLKHGGIHKSLERHADATFAKLSLNEQELARSIFGGLIEIGRGTQDTKRTALFDELIPTNAKAEDVLIIVQKLADARLIITDEQAGKDTVTISHEKLIEAWPWLKKLVNENRDAIALQNEIASDAKEWEDHNRDESYLYSGARLATAREQLGANKIVLSDLSQIFVDSSQETEEAEQRKEEQRRQKEVEDARRLAEAETKRAEIEKQRAEEQTRSATNLRRRSLYLTIALVAALIAVSAAVFFGFQSQQQTKIAIANEELAQVNAEESLRQAKIARTVAYSLKFRDRNFLPSMLLGIEGYLTASTVLTRDNLLQVVQTNPQLLRYLIKHQGEVNSVAFSPDGKLLASGSADNTIILWDMEAHEPIGQPLKGHTSSVLSVAFSPDGQTLASGSWDNTIILWNAETHQPIGQPFRGHTNIVNSVAFSPDGRTLASGSWDNTIILWNAETHQPIGQPLTGYSIPTNSNPFSPDGKTIAMSDGKNLILFDIATRQPIALLPTDFGNSVSSIAFSPDGQTVAVGGDDEVILFDVTAKQRIYQPFRMEGFVKSVAFSPDEKTLASGDDNGLINLWDIVTGQPVGQPLKGHTQMVASIAFSRDGETIVSGSWDNTIILWHAETYQPISKALTAKGGLTGMALSPNGKMLASVKDDHTVLFWDVLTQEQLSQPLIVPTERVGGLTFNHNGKLLATVTMDSIILWDIESHQPIDRPFSWQGRPEGRPVGSASAFSHDGKMLACECGEDTIILWDVTTHQPIGPPLTGHSEGSGVNSIAFSPDGKLLVSGSGDRYGEIILWDVMTGQKIGQPLNTQVGVSSVVFSPDGKMLASGSYRDIFIMLWDVESHRAIGQWLTGDRNSVYDLAFSQDGKVLASGSGRNTILLWDVETGLTIGHPLTGHTELLNGLAFTPDGKTLISGSFDNPVILWNLDPQLWIQKTCERVGRNFTRTEWAQYFPGEEYRKTCEQWPLEPELTSTPSPTP